MLIGDRNLSRPGHRNELTAFASNRFQIVETSATAVLDLDAVDGRRSRRSTTNVERAHSKLRSRLTDRLCSNDTDGFTRVYLVPASQVPSITLPTNPKTRFTAYCRANDDFVQAKIIELFDPGLIEHGAGFNQHGLTVELIDVFRNNTTEHPVT